MRIFCILMLLAGGLIISGCSTNLNGTLFADARTDSDYKGVPELSMEAPLQFPDGSWSDMPTSTQPPKTEAELRAQARKIAAKAKRDMSLIGSAIKAKQSRLCDGSLETGVVIRPGESITFPAPDPGCRLVVHVSDANRLGQMSMIVKGGERCFSFYSGWNDLLPTDHPVTFRFCPAPGEPTEPIFILEVRQVQPPARV